MERDVAEETSLVLLAVMTELDTQIGKIEGRCAPEELKNYRRRFGEALSAALNILNPIWSEHPALLPAALSGDYLVDAGPTAEAKALVERAGEIVRAKRY